jgi:septum formation protein
MIFHTTSFYIFLHECRRKGDGSMKSLILASQSPRRRELLEQVGLRFTVHPSTIEEQVEEEMTPEALVQELARQKAADVYSHYPEDIVLGADTLVAVDGEVLGKPRSEEEAAEMLHKLSGKTHQVHTGTAIISGQGETVFAETVHVTFYPLTESEIDTYIQSKEPEDKAGAYGIQGLGAVLVERIEGDYFSIVGLPVARVVRVLKKHGSG